MNRFKNILYVTEASVAQDAAMARAVALARNNQADLTVIDVIPAIPLGMGMPPGALMRIDFQAAMAAEHRKLLESLVAPYRQQLSIEVEVLAGRRFLEVIRAVLRNGHDLVLKPAEDPSWVNRLFGSDDMHLLRKCPCPVWLTKPAEKSNYECIVAALGFDPTDADSVEQELNREILELSTSLALSDFAALHLAHAWDAPEVGFVRLWVDDPDVTEASIIAGEQLRHKSAMALLNQSLRERLGEQSYAYLSPRIHLPQGAAHVAIPALVNELQADLVVMGTVARSGVAGMIIGNTAEAILDQLKCSVLAIKPPGFVSPVTSD